MNPQFPVYIISKGRWESRITTRALDRMGVGTSAADRTAKATEAIERYTKDILRTAEAGGAVFGS